MAVEVKGVKDKMEARGFACCDEDTMTEGEKLVRR